MSREPAYMFEKMAEDGLLVRRRDGVHVYYALDDPTLGALCMLVRTRLQEEKER